MNTPDINDVYKPPKAELIEKRKQEEGLQFFGVSIKKLCIMYILTLGFYILVYFYQHWKIYKIQNNLRISPVLRTVFAVFFIYSLFDKIDKKAKERNIAKLPAFSALATLYAITAVASGIAGSVTGPEEVIGTVVSFAFNMLGLYPLYRVQFVVNAINNDEKGTINSRFTAINWAFIILGLFVWITTVISTYSQLSLLK